MKLVTVSTLTPGEGMQERGETRRARRDGRRDGTRDGKVQDLPTVFLSLVLVSLFKLVTFQSVLALWCPFMSVFACVAWLCCV